MMTNTPAKPSPDAYKLTDEELIRRLDFLLPMLSPDQTATVNRATLRLAALISERDRLKEALAPFAALPPVVYSALDGAPLYAAHYWAVVGHPDKSHFTHDDLARARAALSPTQEKAKSVSIGKKCLYCSLIVKDNDRCGCDPDGDEIASFGAVSYGHDGCEK